MVPGGGKRWHFAEESGAAVPASTGASVEQQRGAYATSVLGIFAIAVLAFVFIEVELGDVGEFYLRPLMQIVREDAHVIVSVNRCSSVAHVIAAMPLELAKHGPRG